MTEQRITLPWPPKILSPNARVHWAQKSKAAKAYRAVCWALCKEAGLVAAVTTGRLHLWLDFYAPDKRRRDDDNMIASFKAGRDGIADALGVDDHRFICHTFVRDEIGGMVKFVVTTGPTP
jgi:crossover junction endodeoxyribonuclease RusA